MSQTRRLAAILAADVAGYSRLMGADEEGTLERLKALRHELVDPKIAEHHGRIVKTTGDGLLVEFASVVDAVRCAVAVQQAMPERDMGLAADGRIELRIGINLGDVIVEGDDLYGDGVNIAARIEALADAGGVFVSNTVYDHVRDRLPFVFEDLGEQQVKNIARPVRVYRVRHAAPKAPAPPALPLPDKPSIAVLPFANMSGDPEQEFFADGIAEDVITALSRYPSLFVIARNSCFTYKGKSVDVKQIGRELGVRYVLEGSLRKAGNRIRVTAQLVEAETGNHVWAERYDRDLADIFAVQDEITEAVTIAIAPAVAQAEQQRAMRKPPENLDAWAAYQRGLWHIGRATAEDTRLAHDFFQGATEVDPSFAGGYIGLASAISAAATAFGTAALSETQSVEESLARRAIALDPSNAQAYICLSVALRDRGDLAGALAEAERAVTLCPNMASAHGRKGQALVFSGKPRAGIEALETALRLDPCSPIMWRELQYLTIGRYLCREYEAAAETAERVIRLYPDFRLPYHWLAASLGQLGRTDEARRVLERAIALSALARRSFTRVSFRSLPWMRPEVTDHLFDGLRKAGWQG
jgi:adenylate cyclase